MSLELNQSLCIQCEKCIKECPQNIFVKEDQVGINQARLAGCIHCGHCEAVCPQQAITVDGVAPDDLMLLHPDPISEHQRHMLLKSRRSVRHYLSKPVPDDVINAVLEDVLYAPTARNSRKVGWIVVNNAQQVHILAEQVAMHMAGAPAPYDLVAKTFASGKDVILRGAPCLLLAHAPDDWEWAAVDCSIAATYAELSLHSRGLGTCWAGFLIRIARQFDIGLGLPEGHHVYAGLMTGYPSIHYASLPPRSPLDIRYM